MMGNDAESHFCMFACACESQGMPTNGEIADSHSANILSKSDAAMSSTDAASEAKCSEAVSRREETSLVARCSSITAQAIATSSLSR